MTERDVPFYIHALIERLAACGKRGYPVGGCVRDLLMGRTPHDFDMTADATPDEMLRIFADLRVIPTGRAHGTVTVMLEKEGFPAPKFSVDESIKDFYAFTKDSFKMENYQFHPFEFEIPMAI